jgi:hypothetical protein
VGGLERRDDWEWERGWLFRWTTPVACVLLLIGATVAAGLGSEDAAGAAFLITGFAITVFLAIAVYEDRKSHGLPGIWWVLGIFFFGLIGFMVYLRDRKRQARWQAETAESPAEAVESRPEAEPARVEPSAAERPAEVERFKKCPDCAERVLAEARVCRFCGYRFEPPPSAT